MRDAIQKADNDYCALVKSRRVRVVEAGGDKLSNILGRNDPWANKGVCDDKDCPPCSSRTWLIEEIKSAKASKQELPSQLVTRTSHQCRREGQNYTVQCLPCIRLGRKHYTGGKHKEAAGRGTRSTSRTYNQAWYLLH